VLYLSLRLLLSHALSLVVLLVSWSIVPVVFMLAIVNIIFDEFVMIIKTQLQRFSRKKESPTKRM
jgi:hypothetical protein